MESAFPVIFTLFVNGKRIGAAIETVLYGEFYNLFSIRFNDGYHDCFFDNGDGTIRAINEIKSKPYLSALKYELPVFKHFTKDSQLENFPYEKGGQFANGWILKNQYTTGLVYTIFLKGVYQFDIIEKQDGWTAVVKDAPGNAPIDTKLAQHAFAWASAPTPESAEREEQPVSIAAKPIEFLLEFQMEGNTVTGHAILLDTKPWPQCSVVISQPGEKEKIDLFDFFKVDNKDKVFSWIPYKRKKEKIAVLIAQALEKHFAVERIYSSN